mgnify:CR=1 FL=1
MMARRMLREAGYPGYRLHWRIDDEDGRYVCRPDIAYPGRKVARNRKKEAALLELRWDVHTIWECDIGEGFNSLIIS